MTGELARTGVAVIAGVGVYAPADADALLADGALVVQLDTVLRRRDWLEG